MAEQRAALDVGPLTVVDVVRVDSYHEEVLVLVVADAFEIEDDVAAEHLGLGYCDIEARLLAELSPCRVGERLAVVDTAAGREPPRAVVGTGRVAAA